MGSSPSSSSHWPHRVARKLIKEDVHEMLWRNCQAESRVINNSLRTTEVNVKWWKGEVVGFWNTMVEERHSKDSSKITPEGVKQPSLGSLNRSRKAKRGLLWSHHTHQARRVLTTREQNAQEWPAVCSLLCLGECPQWCRHPNPRACEYECDTAEGLCRCKLGLKLWTAYWITQVGTSN